MKTINQPINETPGTLHYHGEYHDGIIIEVIEYDQKEFSRYIIKSIQELKQRDIIQWINVIGLYDIDLLEYIKDTFGIHRIDMEDILNTKQRSKIDHKDDYLFSILKMAYINRNIIIHEHVSVLVIDNLLISFQETPGDVFDPIRTRIEKNSGQIRNSGVDYLYFSILDCLVDQYIEIGNFIEKDLTEAEALIFEGDNKIADQVYSLRKELITIKNDIIPVRDSLSRFLKKGSSFITEETSPYFADVHENLLHSIDAVNTYREMANSLSEMQISKTSNDMNRIMMTLTFFSAIFIPLSFLAGVFGMNFSSLPGLSSEYSFVLFITSCIIIVCLMIWFFKEHKWL